MQCLIILCCFALSGKLFADHVPSDLQAITLTEGHMTSEKRLSEYLLQFQEKDPSVFWYFEGTVWGTLIEKPAQRRIKNDLLNSLQSIESKHNLLEKWLERMPVTGRVVLSASDPRYLQAKPALDPILGLHDSVSVPAYPNHVWVLDARGSPCVVRFEAMRTVSDFVQACYPNMSLYSEFAYLIQPRGEILKVPLGVWNPSVQPYPAPGATIWFHDKNGVQVLEKGVDAEHFSELMAQFLSTQGVLPINAGIFSQNLVRQRDLLPPTASVWYPGQSRATKLAVTASDFGTPGLWQTPSARMRPAGQFSYTHVLLDPYRFYSVMMQPYDWLEYGLRYAAIDNRPYCPNCSQTYKDKSFDIKLRLLKEKAWQPELSLGVKDLGGTGLFAGEYLVASKRFGDFDMSLGLGWGYNGLRGDVSNPLGFLSEQFKQRVEANVGRGGQVDTGRFFRGPSAFFGGIQYQTPWQPLVVKLEYDGNDYQKEPLNNVFLQKSRFNYGLTYRVNSFVDLRLARERGNTTMVGISLTADLLGPPTQKILDPAPIAVEPFAVSRLEKSTTNWRSTVGDIEKYTDWRVRKIEKSGRQLKLSIDQATGPYYAEQIERASAVLHRDAPDSIHWLAYEFKDMGMGIASRVVDREAFARARSQLLPPKDNRPAISEGAALSSFSPQADLQMVYEQQHNPWSLKIQPTYRQIINGGASGFFFYELGVGAHLGYELSSKTRFSGFLKYRVFDNFDTYQTARATTEGTLPKVRTQLRNYYTASHFNVPTLTVQHFEQLGKSHYFSVYGGLLESFFGGFGTEYLYRPQKSSVAFGIDLNRVRQRGFEQRFTFMDYSANTGHATLYWDTGFQDILAAMSVGQYLAGDRGFTIDLSRVFRNGVTMGGFFTRTNASAQEFGEGSFDKGVYLAIPFDILLPRSSSGTIYSSFQPLTRDGGAKLVRPVSLYDFTEKSSARAMSTRSNFH